VARKDLRSGAGLRLESAEAVHAREGEKRRVRALHYRAERRVDGPEVDEAWSLNRVWATTAEYRGKNA